MSYFFDLFLKRFFLKRELLCIQTYNKLLSNQRPGMFALKIVMLWNLINLEVGGRAGFLGYMLKSRRSPFLSSLLGLLRYNKSFFKIFTSSDG